MVQFAAVFGAGGHEIDAGGVDAAVPQQVGQLGDVLVQAVEGAGEELPQIVRKDFSGPDGGPGAELLHLPPDGAAVQGRTLAAAEQDARANPPVFCVLQELTAQLPRQQHRPGLALAADSDLPLRHRLRCEIAQLGYPDAGGADGLENQLQPGISPGGFQKPEILLPAQLLLLPAVGLVLAPQILHPAVRPSQKGHEAIEGCQHRIDRAQAVALLQLLLIGQGQFLGQVPSGGITQKRRRIPQILLQSGAALLLPDQVVPEGL